MRGFTLLEVICIVVLLGLCGAALAQHMAGMATTAEPLARVQGSLDIQRVMESIAGDYNSGTDLATLATRIRNSSNIANGVLHMEQENAYGQYMLPQNGLRWVKFNSANQMVNVSHGDPLNTLFVEIQNPQGHSVSTLFFR